MGLKDYIISTEPKQKAVAVAVGCLAVGAFIALITSLFSQWVASAILVVSLTFNWVTVRFSWAPGHDAMVKMYKFTIDNYDMLTGLFYLTFLVVGTLIGEYRDFSVSFGVLMVLYCLSDALLYFTLDDQVDHGHP